MTNFTNISDLRTSEIIIKLIMISVNYNNWIPSIENEYIFNSSVPAALVIVKDIKENNAPYNRFNGIKTIKSSGSLAKHYIWAKQESETPGTFRETRIYICDDNNKPIFTSRLMDGFDEFVHSHFYKAAE